MATFYVQNDTDKSVYLQSKKNDQTIEVKANSKDSTHLFTDEVYDKVSKKFGVPGETFLRPSGATYYKVVVRGSGSLQLNSEKIK